MTSLQNLETCHWHLPSVAPNWASTYFQLYERRESQATSPFKYSAFPLPHLSLINTLKDHQDLSYFSPPLYKYIWEQMRKRLNTSWEITYYLVGTCSWKAGITKGLCFSSKVHSFVLRQSKYQDSFTFFFFISGL